MDAVCNNLGALILAAGMSSRMGDFKPLMALRGKTLIENAVDSVFEGGASFACVVVGFRGSELSELLSAKYGSKVIIVRNEAFADTDMLHSIKLGCRAMPACRAFFLLPGDMPVVKAQTFRMLADAERKTKSAVVFPSLSGWRKHPPLIKFDFVPKILDFCGDGGLRKLWEDHLQEISTVPVDDCGICVDLDTNNDYCCCKKEYERGDER